MRPSIWSFPTQQTLPPAADLSAQYIVAQDLAPVMSSSLWRLGEEPPVQHGDAFYYNLWKKPAALGITVFVATGDNGVEECLRLRQADGCGRLSQYPLRVAVGGTMFDEGSDPSRTGTTPTMRWGARPSVISPRSPGTNVAADTQARCAGGGGPSTIYPKPSWQVAPGVPNDGKRDIPDVALQAASHDAYQVEMDGVQRASLWYLRFQPRVCGHHGPGRAEDRSRQGNANPILYRMANYQYTTSRLAGSTTSPRATTVRWVSPGTMRVPATIWSPAWVRWMPRCWSTIGERPCSRR